MDRKQPEQPPRVQVIRSKDEPFSPLPDHVRTISLEDLLGTRTWEDLEAIPLTAQNSEQS